MTVMVVTKAADWWAAQADSLPDTSFAYIEPGGALDATQKTAPRVLRHLPYRDATGAVDPQQAERCLKAIDATGLPKATRKRIAKRLEFEMRQTQKYSEDQERDDHGRFAGGGGGGGGLDKALADKAIKTFGTTTSVKDAGYVLPEGQMLDFKDGDPNDVGKLSDSDTADFMHRTGAMQIESTPAGLEVQTERMPTEHQVTTVVEGANGGRLSVTAVDHAERVASPARAAAGARSQTFDNPTVPAVTEWFAARYGESPLTGAKKFDHSPIHGHAIDALAAKMKAEQPGSRVQTLIFDKEKYPKASEAKAWANDHGFKGGKVDETGESFRLRQEDPEKFARLRTISLTEGVSAVVGFPRAAVKAMQTMFVQQNVGVVMKADQADQAAFEAVEETETATVFKVSYGDHTWYYAVGGSPPVAAPIHDYALFKALAKSEYRVVIKAEGDNADEQRYTLGVIYPASQAADPSTDFHGDYMTAVELQKAAWGAMKTDGVGVGLMHRPGTKGSGRMVESYIWPAGAPEWKIKDVGGEEQTIKPGDWLGGVVWEPEAWAAIKRGELRGYSLQGVARHG